MHRCPLSLSLTPSLSPSLDNRRCVHGRVLSPELTPQGISRFLCVDCWTSNKDKAGLSIGFASIHGSSRVSKDPSDPWKAWKPLSRESPFAKWFSNIGSMYAGYVINPCEPIVIRAIFRVIRRIAFRLPIISQCTNPRRGFFQLFFLLFFFFFVFDSDVSSIRDGIPFSVWIRNTERERENGRNSFF